MSRFTRATVRPEIPIIVEEGPTSWGAFAPSVPGAIATGRTRDEAIHNLEAGLSLHFEVLHEEREQEDLALAQAAAQAERSHSST
jgi:predicted RNase H-like HicB family nuclease